MKQIQSLWLLLFVFLQSPICRAQVPVVPINLNQAVSCNGGNNGSITASPTYGTGPYTFLWNTGETTQTLTSITAGVYSVSVRDLNNDPGAGLITVSDPPPLTVQLIPTNILCNGASTGNITTDVRGGTPSYTYLWSPNSEVTSSLRDIPDGNYSVVVTDQNGCTTGGSVTLTQPQPISLIITPNTSHHSYAVSCFKGSDGIINMSVSGGVSPYTYLWTTDQGAIASVLKDPMNQKAGTYNVVVTDANGCTTPGGPVTLYQPQQINVALTPYVWPNGYNVSCFGCFNGSITSNVTGGVTPYSYNWVPSGQSTTNATNLDARTTNLNIIDANGCVAANMVDLRGPSDSWKITGNGGINGSTNFLGTTDQNDLVLRTNSSERLRVSSSGNIKFSSFGAGLLKTSATGDLSNAVAGTDYQTPIAAGTYQAPITAGDGLTFNGNTLNTRWVTSGSDIYSNNSGKVGIGGTPTEKLDVFGNARVQGNILQLGSDLKIGLSDGRSQGQRTQNRALVHGANDDLIINYWSDFEGGVCVQSLNSNHRAFYIQDADTYAENFVVTGSGAVYARQLKLTVNQFPDYVFDDSYCLPSINELKTYIEKHKHLKGIPSATEVASNGGVDVGELQIKMLEKLEELTLIIIKQDEQIKKLENDLKEIKK